MATTKTKRPDKYSVGGGSSQIYSGNSVAFSGTFGNVVFDTSLLGGENIWVSSYSFSASFRRYYEGAIYPNRLTVWCVAKGYDSAGNQVWTSQQAFAWNPETEAQHTFSPSSSLGNESTSRITFTLWATDGGSNSYEIVIDNAVAGYTFTLPALGLSVTPSSLYVGETIRCTISELFGQTFGVSFSYNSTTLQNFSTSSDSFTQTANESWFTTAGVTGDSMQVTVSIADGLGRSASARVTVNKHTALVPTISAPKGGNFDGGQSITFAWTSAGDGSQTKAELQWSKDNVNWSALTTVSGSGTQWTAPAGNFSAGTVYWRLRLTNNHGITSGWVSQSFTVTINAPVVTLTAPTSGSVAGSSSITFAWSIAKGSGTVNGTQMEYSNDGGITWKNLVDASGGVTSYSVPAGSFFSGSMIWRVRAKDSLAGWGAWKQATITITYAGAVVTLTTPTSGSKDGGQSITFVWEVTKGGGNITGVQFQYSDDNGVSWYSKTGLNKDSRQVTISAGTFKAGPIIWRVRALDQYAGYSAWKQATITITYATPVVTLTAPTSGSKDGGKQIAFDWTIAAGSGSVTGTQMEYSTDSGVNWTSLVNSTDKVTSYTAAAGKLPGGAFRWRVRARDTYAGWGDWKTANITISYAAPVVTLTAPTSGTLDGGQAIAFAWTIAKGSGRVNGTQMNYSTDGGITWSELVAIAAEVTSYTAPAGKFKAGSMIWRARAQDQYAGMGEYKQATITISYTPATVTLTTPTSGSLDGAEAITFGWSITKGSGNVTGTQMQISTDDGLTWSDLINSSSQVTTYTSAVAQFPAGRMLWHVRAKDSYSGWGDWKQASITVTYSAVSQVTAVNSPTSGVYNAAAARTFTVRLDASGPVHTPFQIQEATFFWRSGETGEFTELAMTPGGNTASVEIPAGTFPSGRIEWYASATDTTERTTETPHYVLTALQTAVEAAPLSPINTIESGNGPITFRWTYGSLDGAPQGRAQLQYSRDGETWADEHIFADITGEQTTYIAEQGTFPGGSIFWRVRSYNDAGTAGPWSAAVSFSSYSAPLVTGVTGDGKPFATITWQADGQEAYEIEVGGKTYGPYYGADVRSFTLPEPLTDGEYTIRVRAQNKMTLWSQWIEGQMSVVNVPGDDIRIARYENGTLQWNATQPLVIVRQPQDYRGNSTGIFRIGFQVWQDLRDTNELLWRLPGSSTFESIPEEYVVAVAAKSTYWQIRFPDGVNSAEVQFYAHNSVSEIYSRIATWTKANTQTGYQEPLLRGKWESGTGYILVYRDGVRIARTTFVSFTDRTAVGTHEYYVIQVIPNGYYTKSQTVTMTISVDCPMIAELSGGDFLSLKLSENSDREVRITEAREVEWTQYAGADYPSAEIGEGKSKAVALDVSALMSDEDFAKAFTALLGKDVIVKTPDGTVVIGPLDALDLRAPRSHRSWTFGVTQMEWEDFVDES